MYKTVGVLGIAIVVGFSALVAIPAKAADSQSGAVFVMTNAANTNEVISFSRAGDGALVEQGRFATGGRGSGGGVDPLQSQGSLVLSGDHALLFAVNAGSGTISVFRVHGAQLEQIEMAPSGGSSPVAVAQRGRSLYAVNAGPNANVVAFRLAGNGSIEQIPGSAQPLSSANAGPSGLAISPNGQFLVVTERLNNLIDSFRINQDGTLSSTTHNPSSGAGPFSIGFASSGALLATEATSAAISSYALQTNGALNVVAGSVLTGGSAACWHAITPDGHFVYVSNAGTSTISGFTIGVEGGLTPIGAKVVATQPEGSTNLDIAINQNGKFLYSLNTGTGKVGMFAIQSDGSLLSLGTAGEFAAASGANGIAAF
jgi:6-phosphogluconolactonase